MTGHFTSAVELAIEELRTAFPGHAVACIADDQGGGYVRVDNLGIGSAFNESVSWIGFRVTFQYPHADVYPHFLRPDLRWKNGGVLNQSPFGQSKWNGQEAVQLSRKSNRWNPARDTAATKLALVLTYLRRLP